MGYLAKRILFLGQMDRYHYDAIEINIDVMANSYGNTVIGGIMEHIGVYSGDSRQLDDL
ncbi:hypothetical protein C5167_037426 [Papaver somniferum]|uniref:Uncharacterized protein n=1 Tax=Papaver somniferum TaxID=3469 RepID=A0A4Y7I8V3_PAPSO|nr:hypothetical protein C5167_037426 [Papaver somniferum]